MNKRDAIKELDAKIKSAVWELAQITWKPAREPRKAALLALYDERDALIKQVEAEDEADDLWHDLLCAINDAYDGEPLTVPALQAQFANYGLVISRAETKP